MEQNNNRISALLIFGLSATCAPLMWAQATATNPQVNGAIHFDVSSPIRELAATVAPQSGAKQVHPVMSKGKMNGAGQTATVDGALQTAFAPPVSATVGLNLLGVGNGFNGYTVPDAPTDANLAVGDTQVVQWVNVSYAVFDKTSGAVILGPVEGNQFWAGFGGPCETQNDGDIIVQWDKMAHRWLMAQNVFEAPYLTCVAISTTPDATGTFYRYAFPQSNGFPDYPKWGVWSDGYYQHNNVFGGPNGFGSEPCAYDRASMLRGSPNANQICFFAPTIFDDGLLPADIDSPGNLPAAGQPELFLGSIDNTPPTSNVIYAYLFHADFNNPKKSTFTGFGGSMPVSVPIFTLSCGGLGGNCIPQRASASALDSLGDRLMYRLAYRNFGDHQTWLVDHDAATPGGQVGVRWYEFRAAENAAIPKVYQSGTFAGPAGDANFRWMGSIAMDKAGDIALGYSIASQHIYPSINYTGQTAGDAVGTMEAEATIVNGTGSQKGTDDRWGDYSSMAIDAADGCTFWYTNQYYMVTASFDWSTRLASIKFPNCH